MAVPTRTGNQTCFGVDVAVWALDTLELYKYLTDCSLNISSTVQDGRSVMDMDTWLYQGPSSVTLDTSKVAVTGNLPLMAMAFVNPPTFAANLRHSRTGNHYANTSPGSFLITSAKLNCTEGAMTESMSAILQGALTATTPAASAAIAARTDMSSTVYGESLGSLVVAPYGTVDTTPYDMINFFESFDIDVSIGHVEGHAVADVWQWPVQTDRTVTINASKIVEAPVAPATASTLTWFELARSRAVAAVSIVLGSVEFAGNFAVTEAKWTSGGSGTQKETITLRNIGELTAVPTIEES